MSLQGLRGRSLRQSLRGGVQLRRQPVCSGRHWGHALRLRAPRSAVSDADDASDGEAGPGRRGPGGGAREAGPGRRGLGVFTLVLLPPPRDGWTRFRLQRLYFVWVCRELQSFYWFAELLCSVHQKVRRSASFCRHGNASLELSLKSVLNPGSSVYFEAPWLYFHFLFYFILVRGLEQRFYRPLVAV